MLSIKKIRENSNEIKKNLMKRPKYDEKIIDRFLEIDNIWKYSKKKLDQLKSEKNKESNNISKIKKENGDIKKQILKIKNLSNKIKEQEDEVKKQEILKKEFLIKIPNILDKEVPIGRTEEDNKQIKTFKNKPKFNFRVRDHQELCELNNWYELDIASKNSGARFYYLKNELVQLQVALTNFVLNKMQKKGYTIIEVPPMLRKESIGKSVSLEDFKEAIYEIKDENLCLIGTSEHALALLHADEILPLKKLPIKYVGISQCFRKEAGVTKDEKGIFRVHNFNKIEQFIFSTPKESDKLHKEITENCEEIFKELDIHYRIVDICSADIGSFATRKFDIEAWLPSQEKYREMASSSNYRDYGARRLNCRFQDEENNINFVNTLNSTAIAMTRCIIAIIEQHQTENGNVKIPKVLVPYFQRQYLIDKKA